MSPFIRWSNEISITSTVKLHKASSLNVYWKSAQYTVSRDVPWNTCEGQWLNWFNLLPSLLIKNFVVGHVIVRLDYTVTENGTGCLDINIKPQFLFFPLPEGSSNSSLSLFHTLQSKMRLIRETRLMVWEPREESRAIMQPRLTVMDSWCNRKERDGLPDTCHVACNWKRWCVSLQRVMELDYFLTQAWKAAWKELEATQKV